MKSWASSAVCDDDDDDDAANLRRTLADLYLGKTRPNGWILPPNWLWRWCQWNLSLTTRPDDGRTELTSEKAHPPQRDHTRRARTRRPVQSLDTALSILTGSLEMGSARPELSSCDTDHSCWRALSLYLEPKIC